MISFLNIIIYTRISFFEFEFRFIRCLILFQRKIILICFLCNHILTLRNSMNFYKLIWLSLNFVFLCLFFLFIIWGNSERLFYRIFILGLSLIIYNLFFFSKRLQNFSLTLSLFWIKFNWHESILGFLIFLLFRFIFYIFQIRNFLTKFWRIRSK